MRRNVVNVITILAVTAAAAVAVAEIPDLDLSTADVATDNAVLFIRPDGLGDSFTEARVGAGPAVDATITLTLVNFLGDPLPGYPAEDLWLETDGGSLAFAAGGTAADAATDASGQTEWSMPLEAGGCTIGESVMVMVAGQALNQAALPLEFVSPDFNGDLSVNLTDLAPFSSGYTGAYDECADLFYDGIINLTDLALFAPAYGI